MSFKIYSAYRIRPRLNPYEVMISLKATGQQEVRKRLCGVYTRFLEDPTLLKDCLPLKDMAKLSVRDVDLLFHRQYGAQLTLSENNQWDFDVNLTLRKHKNRYYLLPRCSSVSLLCGVLNFLDQDPQLEEYGYWDNSDRPAEVSASAWRTRRKIWTEILSSPESAVQFVECPIVSYQNWSTISPWFEMSQKKSKMLAG